jgi:hypothetical protein
MKRNRAGRPRAPGILAAIFGLAFACAGLAVAVIALGYAPGLAPAAAAPGLAALVALVFFLAGTAMLFYRCSRRLAAGCALAALLAFIMAFNWIAFGPDELSFTRSTSLANPVGASARRDAISEGEGRMVFGAIALVMDALLLAGLYRVARARRSARSGSRPD